MTTQIASPEGSTVLYSLPALGPADGDVLERVRSIAGTCRFPGESLETIYLRRRIPRILDGSTAITSVDVDMIARWGQVDPKWILRGWGLGPAAPGFKVLASFTLPISLPDLVEPLEALTSTYGKGLLTRQHGNALLVYTVGTHDPFGCHCVACDETVRRNAPEDAAVMTGMIVCPSCGNKRCPQAAHHAEPCSGSNALDQSVRSRSSSDTW